MVKKFFNPDNINTKFQRIWDIILEEEKKGDKIRAANCYIAFYEAFKNEIDLNHSVGLEPEDMSKNKFSIKKFAFISKQKYFEAKKYLESISVSKCSDDIKVQSTTSFKQSYIMSDSFDDSQDYQSTVRRYR